MGLYSCVLAWVYMLERDKQNIFVPQPFYPPTHSLLLSRSVGSLWKKAAPAEVGGVERWPPDAPHTSSYGFSPSAALTSVAAAVGGWVQAQFHLTLVESMRVNFMCRLG